MSPSVVLLAVPVVLQVAAAVVALRLIGIAGRRRAWILMAGGLLLGAARRALALLAAVTDAIPAAGATLDTVLAVGVSALLLAAVVDMGASLRQARADGRAASAAALRLRESEEKLRSLTESATAAIFVYQGNNFRYVNRAACELCGLEPEELLAIDFWDVIHPDHREMARERGLARQDGAPPTAHYEFKLLRKDGQVRWVDFTASSVAFDGRPAGLGTAFDITERKEMERQLRESRRASATLLSNLPGMAYRCANDPGWTMEFVSEGCRELTGYERSDLVGNARVSYAELVHPVDRPRIWEQVQEALREREPFRLLYRIRRADGDERWVWEQGLGVHSDDGALLALEGFITDTSDRVRAEQALRESEERFRSIFSNASIGIYRSSPEGRFLIANPTLVGLLGYASEDDLAARNLEEERVYRDFTRTEWRERMDREGEVRGLETTLLRADGTPVHVRESAHAVRDRAGRVLYYEGTIEDVSERRQLEEQLRQALKMESVGRLAGGIAHDLNNLLVPIIAGTEMAIRHGSGVPEIQRELDIVHRAAVRAADLTKKLLAFARKQVLQRTDLDLRESVTAALPMLRRLIPENVAIEFVSGGRLGTVRADPTQVEQVLINLCSNASEAMPDGGRITVEATDVVVDGKFVVVHPWAIEGRYVLLSVTDSGCGMDEATRKHLFEPFFTTKGEGRGTGLGLATVYGIVKQHNGMIHVRSEPGAGSTFEVYLPIVERKHIEAGAAAAASATGGSESILIVEDDPSVRATLVEVLTVLGYRIAVATDGIEALDLLRADPDRFDLVISDVVMPRMGGVELCRVALMAAPRARFLLSSGYSENVVSEEVIAECRAGFIAKPYGIDALARKVREVLASRSA
ncbi:MAG: PAS domain S-box protein [Acidobacteria bacterium]|nr:PAS domain S-box protein [Acidobacteriota bacterium]